MKIKKHLARLVALSLSLCLLLAFSGCGFQVTYENAESYTAGALQTEKTIKSLEIHWVSGEVSVLGAMTTKLIAYDNHAAGGEEGLYHQLDGDTLRIYPCASGIDAPDFAKKLTVKIPLAYAYELESVRIVAVGDTKATLGSLGTQDLTVTAEDGDVSFDGSFETASITTKRGNFTAKSMSFDKLNFVSDKGNANLSLHTNGFTAVMREGKGRFTTTYAAYRNGDVYTFGTMEDELLLLTAGTVTLKDSPIQ